MSGTAEDEPGAPSGSQRSHTIHVCIKGLKKSKEITVRQLKCGLAKRLEVPAEQLVLIHSSRVLKDSEVLSHLKAADGSVSLSVGQRPQQPTAPPTSDAPASKVAQSDQKDDLDPDSFTPSPSSPLCLVEALDGLGLANSRQGFFPALQQQMEGQLLADPEMLHHVLGSHFVQRALSTSSPQLIRQIILSNPQIQQLLETKPEVADVLNNADVITQVQEFIRNPDMIEETLHNEDRALDNLQSEHDNTKSTTCDTDNDQKSDPKRLQSQVQTEMPQILTSSFMNYQPTEKEKEQTPPLSSDSTDPPRKLTTTSLDDPNPHNAVTPGMQSLLEEITASPGLMESLLSGPYLSSLLNCLSQNPDLAAQMLLSHPLFSGNPLLQQQMKQQIPLFLQQMQSPELLSAMLNPRAMEALLQIQQVLQTLAAEAPALIPMAGLEKIPTSVDSASACDFAWKDQSGNGPGVATVTEQQQQQFVQQMLQALANTDGVHVKEFPEEKGS
ncbi:ubiquilin-1-like [Xyrichtys novacula]|uniref:Ubiquilin-1-like n=1 Tax=Xyrichtys novacula TaxID=13765 RepID=A0AAV1G6I5_XYRNO|nr:ubiquilin-1-like [Xyrichtys novacula]